MIYNDKIHNFDLFIQNWNKDDEYLLFGKSKECFQFIRTMNLLLGENTLKIKGLLDFEQKCIEEGNDISSIFPNYYNANNNIEKNDNIKIKLLPVEEIKNRNNIKVIVATDFYRNQVVEYLVRLGLKEDIDFCVYKKISAIWPLIYKNLVHIYRIDQTVTTKCSLNCSYCNMFMPFYEKQAHMQKEQLIKDIDILFSKVDYISTYHLVGGEPILYPKIDEILTYIGKNYRSKIDNLMITTNATVPPKSSTMKLMKEYNVYIALSDYTKSLPGIKDKVEQNIELMKSNELYCVVRDANKWSDFGDPRVEIFKETNEIIKHFDSCKAPYRGITNGKFYYCNLSMSAEASGLHAATDNDFIELHKNISKEELLKFDLGFTKAGYISLCKSCNGCYTGIDIPVSPRQQGLRDFQSKG